MKNQLRGVIGLVIPFFIATACSGPSGDAGDGGDSGDDAETGGTSGSGGSGTSGTPATGGTQATGGTVATGGASTGGVASTGGTSTGGAVGTGGSSTGGTSGAVGTGGTVPGGSGGMTGGAGTGGRGGTSNGGTAGAMGGRGGVGSAGKGGAGGKGGSGGGSAGKGGSGGSAGSTCTTWPTANGSQSVPSTIQVSGTYDGMMKRFTGSGALGGSGQDEGQDPIFEIANGGTLKNVILGSPAADGVHCRGNCTIENVWWEDVGEDAATMQGTSSSQTMTIRCGGARGASDKVFQHNGGGTLTIQNFTVETFGKLYRSCGNCDDQYARHVVLQDITARSGSTLVGINTNYGDSADFERITIFGNIGICDRYTGNNTGAEPVKTGSGSDSQYCRYTSTDITQR